MKEWLVDTLGLDPNFAGAVQVIIAFVVILTLIGIFTWILARIKGMRIETARRSRQPRLAVMDSTPIDNQRRLVLVRRDAVEHLILVGGETDIVVEQTIVRGAPIVAQPQRQPFPAAVPAPQTAPPQPVAPPQPAAAAQVQQAQTQPAQAQRAPGAQQSSPAPAQRPRPAQQQQRAAAPPPGQRPAAETAAAAARQPASQADQKSGLTKTGLVGAAAGALGFGQKKPRDVAPAAEVSSPNADAVQRALTPDQSDQRPARPSGPSDPVEQGPGAPANAPPAGAPPSGAPQASAPVNAPVSTQAGGGAAPSINLEQAIGNAVAQETRTRVQPAGQSSPVAKPQVKLSPKDELASQLEELLNTPPPVKPAKNGTAKPESKTPQTEAADAVSAAPEIRSPAAPEAPKPAAPTVAPPVLAAPRQQSAPTPVPIPAPIPVPAASPAQPSAQSTASVDEKTDVNVPKVGTEPATAKADDIPNVSPPPRADVDKTIPGGVAAPMVEPRPERSSSTDNVPKIASIPSAPPVSSPVVSQNAAHAAPEPRVDMPEPDTKNEKSDSIASIEEEMAKLLSELSGPPKT